MGMGGRLGSVEELEAIRAGEVPGKTLVYSRPAMTGEQFAAWKHVVACAQQFVRCANEFPHIPDASAEYYEALLDAQTREARAWDDAPTWIPWPTSEGFWWLRLRRNHDARFLTRAKRREGQPSLVVEHMGSDHADLRSAITDASMEFLPAHVEEPRGGE